LNLNKKYMNRRSFLALYALRPQDTTRCASGVVTQSAGKHRENPILVVGKTMLGFASASMTKSEKRMRAYDRIA
jgi:hypothetical protein